MKHNASLFTLLKILILILAIVLIINLTTQTDKEVGRYGYTKSDQENLIDTLKTSYLDNAKYDVNDGLDKFFDEVSYDYEAEELNLVNIICIKDETVYKFVYSVIPDEGKVYLVFVYQATIQYDEGIAVDSNHVTSLLNKIY